MAADGTGQTASLCIRLYRNRVPIFSELKHRFGYLTNMNDLFGTMGQNI